MERAPALRTGGQNVDLKRAGLQVIERMGLEDQVRAAYTGELGLEFVQARGQALARFPVGDPSGMSLTSDVEILRGDLAELLVSATDWWRWFNTPGGTISLRPDRHGTTGALEGRPCT